MRITVPSNAEISGGVMIFQLFEDKVSAITQQIIALAQQGAYNNNRFGRISPNFVIQGGNLAGTQFTAPIFDDQFHTQLLHMGAGYLSMANLGDGVLSNGDLVSGDDTNSSEYFITLAAARFLDGNHSVFGFQTAGHALREQIGDVSVNGETPVNPVVQQTVDIFTDPFNGVLTLTAPQGASGTSEITITVSDGNGGTMQRVIQVTVQADTANMAPFLNNIAPVSTPQNTPVVVPLTATDAEGDNFVIDAQRRATINFDNTASERGKTPTGTSVFTHKGSNWTGGEVIAARNAQNQLLDSALGSFDSGVYLVNGQAAQVVFDTPIDKVNFFYVHGLGVPAGTATAFDASGNVLGSVNTSAASTFAAAGNFKTLDFASPIKRITFTSGIIDAFDYTQYAFAVTPTNAQGNAQLTVTPPNGFVGDIEILVRVKPVGATTTASRIDTQIINISVNAALQANLQGTPTGAHGVELDESFAADVQSLLSAAIEAWHFDAQIGADFEIELDYRDLGGVALAMTQIVERDAAGAPTRAVITLDDDAAGIGWHIGASAPTVDSGFDLYSVLLHEVGHVHDSIIGDGDMHHDEYGVMATHLSPGERLNLTDLALLNFNEIEV
jgi:cyclophilin family peptidyl-prolyl cis-trans isomerase